MRNVHGGARFPLRAEFKDGTFSRNRLAKRRGTWHVFGRATAGKVEFYGNPKHSRCSVFLAMFPKCQGRTQVVFSWPRKPGSAIFSGPIKPGSAIASLVSRTGPGGVLQTVDRGVGNRFEVRKGIARNLAASQGSDSDANWRHRRHFFCGRHCIRHLVPPGLGSARKARWCRNSLKSKLSEANSGQKTRRPHLWTSGPFFRVRCPKQGAQKAKAGRYHSLTRRGAVARAQGMCGADARSDHRCRHSWLRQLATIGRGVTTRDEPLRLFVRLDLGRPLTMRGHAALRRHRSKPRYDGILS